MAKRLLDILLSAVGLLIASPVLLVVMFLVWNQDRHSPLYIAPRTGLGGRPFRMVKLRSMLKGAAAMGADSTSSNDWRITPVGRFIRRYKLDELSQLWNVLIGEMSLVGPRPNVANETDRYSAEERGLLDVRPGITDFSSIVFSDEAEILRDSSNADLDYNRLIRPWKSRLGLFYVANRSFWIDLQLIWLTALAMTGRQKALDGVVRLLGRMGAPEELRRIAARRDPLVPSPPPGMDRPVEARDMARA